jgi:MarR family transcriptional regulator, organic hydroperoxide resistance regulator
MSATTATPALEAWSLLEQLILTTKQQVMTLAREFELSPPGLVALRSLDPDEPLPMSELASCLHLDNSTVTGIVDRLEERGLVERRTGAHDRRVKMLVVTEAGAAVRTRIVERFAAVPTPLTKLSRKDQIALRDILRRALAAD